MRKNPKVGHKTTSIRGQVRALPVGAPRSLELAAGFPSLNTEFIPRPTCPGLGIAAMDESVGAFGIQFDVDLVGTIGTGQRDGNCGDSDAPRPAVQPRLKY